LKKKLQTVPYLDCPHIVNFEIQDLNYLAHAYLSFDDPGILVGNLISDFVKGKKQYDYPPEIQKGIRLHRAIDVFTDDHEMTRLAKDIFRPAYRLYGGALTDVVYDHFLAINDNEFTKNSLLDFSQEVYAQLDRHKKWFPERFAMMYPYMKSQNWLYNYQSIWGTGRSLEGVVRRAVYLVESDTAFGLFQEHYQLFDQYFRQFWADMKPFARAQFELLTKSPP
jgi:acyl carrier protein phosphodiesterase